MTDHEKMQKPLHRLEDLAELAGVSISTISRALSGSQLVNKATRQKIIELAQKNNYQGRFSDRLVNETITGTVSVIIPPPHGRESCLADPFLLSLIGSIGDALKEKDCDMLLSHYDLSDYHNALELISSGRADGLIVLGQSSLHANLNEMAKSFAPFVVWGGQLKGQHYCTVGSDNRQGGRRATNHLLRMGCQHIAFVGDTESPEANLRYMGYLDALKEKDITPDPNLMRPAHFYPESAMETIDTLLEEGTPFDGIVAASDMIAIGAIRALNNAGLSVPKDISVIGYDDVPLAAYTNPALTTVRQDTAKAGRMMVSKLQRLIKGEKVKSSFLPTDLIIRESCGA